MGNSILYTVKDGKVDEVIMDFEFEGLFGKIKDSVNIYENMELLK